MIAVEDSALVLLAAGRGERFGGNGAKLEAILGGQALGLHAAVTLADLPFRQRIAVTGPARLDFAALGFACVENADPAAGMARSIRLGVSAVGDAAAVVIVLADMPCVTAAHVRRLFDAADAEETVVASNDGRSPKPPALFGRTHFATLLALEGDAGARDLLRGGRQVVADAGELVDVDTMGDLERLRSVPSPRP